MLLDGQEIRVAVSHRLMVDPGARAPLAASLLCRAFFRGPQDLSISDGANDLGRRVWCGGGGGLALIYSLRWLHPHRPLSYLVRPRGGKRRVRLMTALGPLARAMDPATSRP